MTVKDICGKWQGTYTFGEDYPDEYKGSSIPFELEIKRTFWGSIKGIIIDDVSAGGIDDIATVTGNLYGDEINFLKKYRFAHTLNEDGKIETDMKANPIPIRYRAKYDSASNSFKGSWSIEMVMVVDGLEYECVGSGIWEMKRAADS